MLHRIAVLILAAAPAAVLLAYGAAKTRASWRDDALWRAVLLGMVCALVAAGLEAVLSHVLHPARLPAIADALIEALVIAAIIEETTKFAALIFIAERDIDARRRQDLVLLALGISLGFAAVENFFYLASDETFQATALSRAVAAVPSHGVDGLAMGALLTAARLKPADRWRVALALGVPVIMHAAYDFPLFLAEATRSRWGVLIWLPIVPISVGLAIFLGNRILPLAREADRVAGVDRDLGPSPSQMVLGGLLLIAICPVLAAIAWLAFTSGPIAAGAAALGFIPAMFGADLIRSGRRAAAVL